MRATDELREKVARAICDRAESTGDYYWEDYVADADGILALVREHDAARGTKGPYEARECPGMPTDCCDYGVVSLSAGREVCRVWLLSDAVRIAELLAAHEADTLPTASRPVRGAHDMTKERRMEIEIPTGTICQIGDITTSDEATILGAVIEMDEAACKAAARMFCDPVVLIPAAELTRLRAREAARPVYSDGWLYLNPDTGPEWAEQHPIESGECPDAENVRPATATDFLNELIPAWEDLAKARAALAPASGEQKESGDV